jgi:phosphatidate cytidylyltransferase
MKRVLTALVLLTIVLLVVLMAPDWLFAAVVAVFGVIAADEYLRLAAAYGPVFRRPVLVLLAAAFLTVVGLYAAGDSRGEPTSLALLLVLALLPLLLLPVALRVENLSQALPAATLSGFAGTYIAVPMASILLIHSMRHGWFFLVLLFFIVWSGDIFAYYVGRSFGRRKLAPRISPGKTWEGAIASIAGALLVALLFAMAGPTIDRFLRDWKILPANTAALYLKPLSIPPLWVPLALAAILNPIAQLGDLVESMIKRGAGAKDSGHILPGHGGVLDRIDALLFAAPPAAILFLLTESYFYR